MRRWIGGAAAGLATALLSLPVGGALEPAAPKDFSVPATPLGITLEPSIRVQPPQGSMPLSVTPGHFADADGMTLYTYAADMPGQSTCTADCAKSSPPFLADAGATPAGDWSLVAREEGGKQWAYKGQPLYRSIKDQKPGDTNGVDANWRVALIDQAPDEVASPAGITLKPLASAAGDIFVDRAGMTLYVFDGDSQDRSACVGDCLKIWTPLQAGELAKPVGDWSTIRRHDGSPQWAYKGRPVYTFTGDRKPGDADGIYVDPRWHVAALKRYFLPAEVRTRINGGVPVLVTADGRTLYARDKFRFSFGGYSVNDGPPPTPAVGRSIGAAGCTGDCTNVWIPLRAEADAHASGYWSLVTRDDGSKQWAYQGYPLYTNVQDKKPGDMLGRDIFDLTDGSHALIWRIATP
jgi:predicted lipoprotein with Yx(FWY)xxD motif